MKLHDHFHCITKINSYMGCRYFCPSCHNSFSRKTNHVCKQRCSACNGVHDFNSTLITCQDCNRNYFGKNCLANHKNTKNCEKKWKCTKCKRIYDRNLFPGKDITKHVCGEFKCRNCKRMRPLDHKCYLQKQAPKNHVENIAYFDLETKTEINEEHRELILSDAGIYDNTNKKYHQFINTNDEEFFKFMLENFQEYTLVAHNGKGFDFQYVIRYLLNNGIKDFKTIKDGSKINLLHLTKHNIRFIDSLNFLSAPLDEFPKTFGIKELAKGFYPYKFNVEENRGYVGKFPKKSDFCFTQMNRKKKDKFKEWYTKNKHKEWNHEKETAKYLKSDVMLLAEGCNIFRESFLEATNEKIDPFASITIAGTCISTFMSLFYKEDTISYENYRIDNFSFSSCVWLDCVAKHDKIKIRHAGNRPEQRITLEDGRSIMVDGFCKETNTVYQFHGCYWHGCKKCFNDNVYNTQRKKKMQWFKE